MAKKGSKKGSKKKKAVETYVSNFELPASLSGDASSSQAVSPLDLFYSSERRCVVHLKLVTWSFLNFEVEVSTTSTLRVIEEIISEHHAGSVGSLTLWKSQVQPKNVLKDYSKTLEDTFSFSERGEDETEDSNRKLECTIYYDFTPIAPDCPLLLTSPRIKAKQEDQDDSSKLTQQQQQQRRKPAPSVHT